ncbi:9829_t:CDS:1, partial [Scutellospora calospora]
MSQVGKKERRLPSDIWNNHFTKDKEISKGHYEETCNYCFYHQTKGSSQDFKEHLANNCSNVSNEI